MTASRRDMTLVVALGIAVFTPSLFWLGNPTNIAAVLMIAILATSRRPSFRVGATYAIVLILVLGSISTLAGAIDAGGAYIVNPNAFGPFFRIAICFLAVASADDPSFVFRRLLWIGTAASAFAVLQVFSPLIAEFTSLHYLAPERSAVFTHEFGDDVLVRVIGFYENPSSVGLLSIVFILLSVTAFDQKAIGRRTLALFVLVHLAAGVLSLSKVFFGGLPILLVQLLVMRHRTAALLAIVAAAGALWLAYSLEYPLLDVVRYAIDSSLDSDTALKGRYLAEQAATIESSWLFGYGAVTIQGVTINDSAYLSVAYLIGAFGIAVLALHLIWALWRQRAHVSGSLYLILAALGLAAVGTNSALGFRVDVVVAAACAVLFSISRRVRSS